MSIANILYNLTIYPFEFLIETVYFLFGSTPVGEKLVIVGLLINIIAIPLYNIADKWQKRELDLQKCFKPKIDEIKSVFVGDKRQMLIQTFYRINNYHPIYSLRGLFGLMIQIPIFIAAYHFITNLEVLKISSFGIIKDLSMPDGLINIAGFSINALPFLMTLFNVLASLIHTRELSSKERVPLFAMAGLFLVILYNSPSALLVYWTTTNLFSLVKNLILLKANEIKSFFIKTKKVWIVISIVCLISPISFLFKFMKIGSDGKRIIIIGFIATAIIYLYKFITSRNYKADYKLFLFSSISLSILTGLFIPSSLISSSPNEFDNPFNLIFMNLSSMFGILFLYPVLFFKIFSDKTKKFLMFVFTFTLICSILNTFLFVGNYGTLSDVLLFERRERLISSSIENILTMIVSIIVFILLYIIVVNKKISLLNSFILISLITLIFSSSINLNKIHRVQSKERNAIIKNSQLNDNTDYKIVNLSTDKQNVIILFFDRALGYYVPDILERYPELKSRLDGFVWYPQTLSFYNYTYPSMPSILGGYDYTPTKMNRDSNKSIEDKYRESGFILPKIFSDNGALSTIIKSFFNPIDDNGNSIFSNTPNVNFYHSPFFIDHTIEKSFFNRDINSKQDISYLVSRVSIFRILPMFARHGFYSDGKWFYDNNRDVRLPHGMSEFIYLKSMTNMVKIISNKNTFTYIGNNTVHEAYNVNKDLNATYEVKKAEPEDIEKYGDNLLAKHIYVNSLMLNEVAAFVDYLKSKNVYDNTKIIIVSDHGRWFQEHHQIFKYYTNMNLLEAEYIQGLHAFLMVKDFDKHGSVQTNNNFMTVADVPAIATSHLSNALNPFNSKELINTNKNNGVYVPIGEGRIEDHTKYKFNFDKVFHVKPDIFNPNNWKEIPKEKWQEIIDNE